jgi:aspartate racemase
MTTIGVIGGIGPESTIDYYRLLLAAQAARTPDRAASILINSIDFHHMIAMITANQLAEMTDYLVAQLERLARGGADVALIAANTPHLVFDAVRERAALPLVSIVEATCDAVCHRGFQRVALFGTRFTMEATFYRNVFTRAGLELVIPNADERSFIHNAYMTELVNGVFKPETHDRLLAIVDAIRAREPIDAVILGGTELPLILRENEHDGIALLDTTRIHVDAVMAFTASARGAERPS